MATNHLTEVEKGKNLKLKIGCDELDASKLSSSGTIYPQAYGEVYSNATDVPINIPNFQTFEAVNTAVTSSSLNGDYYVVASNGVTITKNGLYRVVAKVRGIRSIADATVYVGLKLNNSVDLKALDSRASVGVNSELFFNWTSYVNITEETLVNIGVSTNGTSGGTFSLIEWELIVEQVRSD